MKLSNIIKKQLPAIDIHKCVKCGKCVDACPHGAIMKEPGYACARCIKYCISLSVPCNAEQYVFCYELCEACGLCVSVCEAGAINWCEIVID